MAATGAEIASAYVAITVKAPGIAKDIQKQLGGVNTSKLGSQMGAKLADGMKKSLKLGAAGAAAVVGTALVKGFGRLKAIETAEAKMRGIGFSAEEVAGAMDNALASVKGTAFGLGEAATTASQMMAANIKPGRELEGVLKTIANNAALAGTDFGEMGSIFAKAASQANGIQNDVLGQLADKGIPIYKALGDQMGVTAGEVFKLASKGKIDFETFSRAAEAAAGTAAAEMGGTTAGAFDNMMAALGRLGAKILEDIFPLIGPLFQDVTRWLDEAAAHVGPVVDAFGSWLKDSVSWLKENGELLRNTALLVGALGVAFLAIRGTIAVVNGVRSAIAVARGVQLGWNAATYGAAAASYASAGAAKFGLIAHKAWNAVVLVGKGIWALMNGSLLQSAALWVANTGHVVANKVATVAHNAGVSLWLKLAGMQIARGWSASAMWVKNTAALVASKVAQTAVTVATKAAAAGQWLLNAAMSANPIGLVVAGIAALVTGLVWFFTKTELGQKIWGEFTRFLGEAWANVSSFFKTVWDSVLKPVFNAIGSVFKWLWDTVISVIIAAIVIQVKVWGAIFKWLWNTVLKPVFDAIGKIFTWVYQTIILPIVAGIQVAIQAAGAVFSWLWATAVKPAIDNVGRVFTWLYETIIKPVWDGIKSTIKGVWENGIKPVIDTLVKVIQSDPKRAFEAARDGIGKAWEGIKNLAKTPVEFVIDTVINGLIGTVNKILPEKMQIPTVPLPKGFRVGGYTGDVGVNTAAGVVHGREFVTRAESTAKIMRNHPGVLEHMNRHGEIPGYRRGGLVNPLPMGSYSVSQPYHGGHNGIDLAAASGTKVFAAADGVVGLAGSVPMGGNEVYVQHTNGLGTRYSHLSRFATSPGTQVKAGHVIGYVGSTGMSTGPHLHYMVHNPGGGGGNYGSHVNPAPYLGLAGSDLGEAGGAASILDGLMDFAVSKVKGAFPEGGMFVDVAAGLARNAAETMAKAFNPFAASDGHTLLYDNGGWLQPGKHLVENKTGRPERILTDSQWDAISADRGSRGPVTVFIGDRQFEGWMDDRADAAVDRGMGDRAAADRFASYV